LNLERRTLSIETENRVETGRVAQELRPEHWLTPGRFALVLGLLVFASFGAVLVGGRTFIIRDYGMFSYPVAFFQRQCFWRGELPLWNPYNHCGLPFLAQWNTLALYPPALIYLLFPLGWSLSFFCLGHLFWGGLGMYYLARRWTGDSWAGGLAGVIFSFNGLMLNFLMWPSHVATFGWLPWVLWLGPEGWRAGGRKWVWGVGAAAMQMLAGGPETILFTWFLLGLFLVCGLPGREVQNPKSKVQSPKSGEQSELLQTQVPDSGLGISDFKFDISNWSIRAGDVVRFIGMGLMVGVICAVQLLPFLQLLAHSQRDAGYASSSHDYSLPFWSWANFLVPLFRTIPTDQGVYFPDGQYWTSSFYGGIGTVLLAAVAVLRVRDRRAWLLMGMVLAALVMALGNSKGSFLYHMLLSRVPAIGFVRYPVKFVILVLAVAPLLAAMGWTALQAIPSSPAGLFPRRRSGAEPHAVGSHAGPGLFEWGCGLVLLTFVGLAVALDWNSTLHENARQVTLLNGVTRALVVVLALMVASAFMKTHGGWRTILGCALIFIFWVDFRTQMPDQNPTASPSAFSPGWTRANADSPQPVFGRSRGMITAAAQDALGQHPLRDLKMNLLRNRLAVRVDCNILDETPQIDGFFSLAPGEAFRLARLPLTKPEVEFPALLDFLGVSQITTVGSNLDFVRRTTVMPMVTAGQQPVFADDRGAFDACSQTNHDFWQTVLLPLEAQGVVTARPQPTARIVEAKVANQRLSIQTETPAPSLVVISQSYYPAWRAYLDGQPARLWRANYAFQAVEVPAGQHHIELRYEDRALVEGATLSVLGLIMLGWVGWRRPRREA
jgi:hypothetical protein